MSTPAGDEKTFRSYSTNDAAQYARHRQQYSEALYQSIISYHTSGGGKLDTAVDLGCGPGIAAFQLAQYFTSVIGLDPSEGMITTARSLLASEGEQPKHSTKFHVSTAEDIDPALIPDSSVDVITAATCAHWFDMPRFWPTAARILKPGGTVAMWCARAASAHPSVPNAAAINAALQAIEDEELLPYFEPGNLLVRELYANIGLPWTVDPPVPTFGRDSFVSQEFGTGEDKPPFYDEDATRHIFSLEAAEKMIATASPVTRWRQAHPEAVGTEDDVVKKMRRAIEKLLHEAGVEKGNEKVRSGVIGVLLMVKKQA